MYRSIIIGLVICLLWGCDPTVSRLYIFNKSRNTITLFISEDSLYDKPVGYFSNPNEDFPFVMSEDTYKYGSIGHWETIIAEGSPDSTLDIFFIDSTALMITDKDSLRKRIVRYHVKLCDLKKNNWIIEYK
jgi:hypothetical protein